MAQAHTIPDAWSTSLAVLLVAGAVIALALAAAPRRKQVAEGRHGLR